MRLSELLFATLRDDPADAEMASHRLLVRAGYIRQLGAGVYSLLPLGFRVAKRVEQVIREEMDAIGGQELSMPVVHPAELWKETGRWSSVGPEMARFEDRAGRDMVLAMTHEEVVADLLRDLVHSYRQLPLSTMTRRGSPGRSCWRRTLRISSTWVRRRSRRCARWPSGCTMTRSRLGPRSSGTTATSLQV
jgi:prolyl-tRNA synthetase